MSKSLAVRKEITPSVWEMIQAIAPAMHKSRLFGVTSPEAAMAIMLKGFELGLPLAASFEFIHVIGGKPSLSPRGALAILHDSPELESMKINRLVDEKGNYLGQEVYMKRKTGFEYTVQFTLEDAKRAGLLKQDSNWEKYPVNMCTYRAAGFCADVVFPDVIGGMKRADELGGRITADGNVIEGEWLASETPEVGYPDPNDQIFENALSDLVERYNVETVMLANGGAIPQNMDELMTAAARLLANQTHEEDAQ